jgi:hypothetical protein
MGGTMGCIHGGEVDVDVGWGRGLLGLLVLVVPTAFLVISCIVYFNLKIRTGLSPASQVPANSSS